MTVSQLPARRPDRKLSNGGTLLSRQPMLYCAECGAEYSANPGDYWNHPKDYVFMCCDEPMALVDKRTVYEPVETQTELSRTLRAIWE